MSMPLMPKATAIWLVENTTLSFEQIAEFCGLHFLEVQAIADGDTTVGMLGLNPITNNQLTLEEIRRCEADSTLRLKLLERVTAESILGRKKSRYTPVSKRQEKPDAIAWLLKFYPNLPESEICQLLGTTKNLIGAVRSKTHWNSAHIKPRSPVQIGMCTQAELDATLQRHLPADEETSGTTQEPVTEQ